MSAWAWGRRLKERTVDYDVLRCPNILKLY